MWGLLPLAELCLRPEPVKPDLLLEDGDDLGDYGLQARVIHTPGHTLGSSCLIVEERIGFVGDLLSTTSLPYRTFVLCSDIHCCAR